MFRILPLSSKALNQTISDPRCQKKQLPLVQKKSIAGLPSPRGQPLSGDPAVPCVCVCTVPRVRSTDRAGAVPEIPIGGVQ